MIALVAGALANKPWNGGNAWTRLSWTRGLGELGFEPYFVEQLTGPGSPDATEFFEAVMSAYSESSRSALLDPDGVVIAGGMSWTELLDIASAAEVLVNLSGHLQLPALRRLVRRSIYLDDDPGYTQFWHAVGALDGRLDGHDAFYTFGTRIGRPGCPIPSCGVAWRGIRPPVVLSDWPACVADGCGRVTTVGSWRGPFAAIHHEGKRYGQKAHELRKFATLPAMAGRELEIALAIDGEEPAVRELRRSGWRFVDPRPLTATPASFRSYVRSSAAELSVAQEIYVETACGWFSDRTTRYLASGRPAIVQDTGFSNELPVGAGLLAFRTPSEAVAELRSIESEYDEHARAARALAEEHFASQHVIGRVLEEVL